MSDYLLEMQLLSEIPNVHEIEHLDSFLMEVDYLTEEQGIELVLVLEKATKKVAKSVEAKKAARVAKTQAWYQTAIKKIQKWYRLAVKKLKDAGTWTVEKLAALKKYALKKYRSVKKLFDKKMADIAAWYKRTKFKVRKKYRAQKANIGTKVGKARKFVVKTGKSIGKHPIKTGLGVAGAGLAAYTGASLYKNYLSGAARACAGKVGPDKAKCMAKFKREAAQVRLEYLKSFMPTCEELGNPQLCKKMIKEQIELSIE
jgi:hypothetical protein